MRVFVVPFAVAAALGCNTPPLYETRARELLQKQGVATEVIAKLTDRNALDARSIDQLSRSTDVAVLHLLGENPATPSAVLEQLARHESFEVKTGVAVNSNAALEVLLTFRSPGTYTTLNDALARNPRLSQAILREMLEKGETGLASLGTNPNCPIEVMRKIDAEGTEIDRAWLATNPNLPDDLLQKLAHDPSNVVRSHAAINPRLRKPIALGGSVEQTSQGEKPALTLLNNFDGLGAGLEPGPRSNRPPAPRNPSDNSLAVGPSHVFQIVNSQLAIFTKTGRLVHGPVSTNTMFAGAGGVCEERPNGDAVVRYDQLARRWLVVMPIFRRTVFDADRSKPGQPAKPGDAARPIPGKPFDSTPGADTRVGPYKPADTRIGPYKPVVGADPRVRPEATGTYAICYAISATADPLGAYYRYVFERPLFPDYPRPAIWPDGYYIPTSTGDDVIQKHACVVERAKMLKGEPAREQCLVIDGVNFLNNADIDGQARPPNGAPNVMMAAGGTQLHRIYEDDGIFVWNLHVDWETPSNTRAVGSVKVPVAPYHYLCDGQLSNCVPQPGSDRRLDAQGDKIMARLVYRKVGGRESIVAVHSVNSSAGGGGVRWYEFTIDKQRELQLHQQGTYAPDRFYRWMASPAIDRRGNIAIGYSFGGSPHYPGQRFAARLASDPLGLLTFHETVLAEGEASQNVMRWQDYTQTAMDPADDCTIWYVGDYIKKDAATYSTRIGSFRIPGCS